MGCGASKAVYVAEFHNGKPDFKYDDVTKSFDEGNGLLFRLVNKKKQQWAYYNDTIDRKMVVNVTFKEGSLVKAMGNTHMETQEEDGLFHATLTVMPLQTELFIEGTVTGFKSSIENLPLESAPLPE
ncbi:Domain of unknown function (DUF1935), putative [Angomonas deanei]|uniref:DUF1935 domain-containing protein n=1 Tax=Angomonas deanei TaxID=59799 RepID=A0A7G2C6J1_9TRYP|nr:Domain of unknown function (DUF1935), putative [Angomonas deanei]